MTVIEELKLKAFAIGEETDDEGCYSDNRFLVVPLDVAIEIVMRGGENDRLRETEGG